MKMIKLYTFLSALLLTTSLMAQTTTEQPATEAQPSKKEITKTVYNFGPLPAIAFDAYKGFQRFAILNIYDFGDGTVYPNTRQQWFFEASFFTKGSQLYTISYDSRFLIPGVRFSSTLTFTNDKAMDFYGFNGYQSYFDYEKIDAGKDGESYIYTPMYRIDRKAMLFKADFTGNLWNNKLFWEAGYHLNYFKQGAINREKINKNKVGRPLARYLGRGSRHSRPKVARHETPLL